MMSIHHGYHELTPAWMQEKLTHTTTRRLATMAVVWARRMNTWDILGHLWTSWDILDSKVSSWKHGDGHQVAPPEMESSSWTPWTSRKMPTRWWWWWWWWWWCRPNTLLGQLGFTMGTFTKLGKPFPHCQVASSHDSVKGGSCPNFGQAALWE